MKFFLFLRKRLNERSTWVSISAGIAGASVLTSPFSWLALVVGVIGAIIPDGDVAQGV